MNNRENLRLKLKCRKLWEENKGLKWKYSFYSALIFYVISSSQAYTLTENLLGSIVKISNNGCPTAFRTIYTYNCIYVSPIFNYESS